MAKPKKQRPAAATQQEVLVNVVLDRSGSMNDNRAGTISGYNEYLSGLRADSAAQYNVSLIQFDAPSVGPELTVSYTDRPIAAVPELTAEGYEPRGMTPLYDAVGECIRRVDGKGRPVVTVIITDGMENASHEFTRDTIKKLIGEKEAEGWKFVFLGANIDSYTVGGSIGVAANATANYAPGNEKALYANLAASTMNYAGNVRSCGLRVAQTMCFMDDSQKQNLMGHPPVQILTGGPSAARPTFPIAGKRTDWTVHGWPPQPGAGVFRSRRDPAHGLQLDAQR